MFEMLQEFFSMRRFVTFKACFEIAFDFFIKYLNRNLKLHLYMLYIIVKSSLMTIFIECFANV
jgi:hypothetical protein